MLKRIEETARRDGSRSAYRSRDGEISYRDLWENSGRLAGYLQEKLPSDGSPLIVYGHKSFMMPVCFLACVRSGHPYCPVDTGMTKTRIRDIAGIVGQLFILAPETEDTGIFGSGYEVLGQKECFQAAQEGPKILNCPERNGEESFYIIFTSGSTGKPKGVVITCDNLEHYLQWSSGLAGGIAEGSVFLDQAPFSFDLSVMDLYTGLYTGSTVIAVDKTLQQDSLAMMAFLTANHVEYWVSTPSFAEVCLAEPQFDEIRLKTIKAFLFCGETLPVKTAAMLKNRFPAAKVINTYGPTESTVCVTAVEITNEMIRRGGALPVGMPKPGTKILIQPDNQEVLILGDTVSPGYFRDLEKTEAAFFTGYEGVCGYRTGDTGHFDEEGLLYCDGRLDRQIKLHGYRIELDDVETNLLKIDGVSQAAVVPFVRKGKVGGMNAFVVVDQCQIPQGFHGRKRIREELGKLLPSYMIPKRVIILDELPLTANDKIDRKRLERTR
ncbi:MAG: D-alanine--poly(phosphoribitol) ligase subunit DltA [Firmicutes bacterium]|nr:D-alanine--poly(phosphoribitol) ligase subunit DltA [Bacillota bacterium]